VYLASRLQLPLVAMGFGYDRPWRVGSWDRFAIPRPFSRARAVPSPAIRVPPDLDRGGLEHFRVKIERLLNDLTAQAERWALCGARSPGQMPIHRQGAPRRDACHAPADGGPHWLALPAVSEAEAAVRGQDGSNAPAAGKARSRTSSPAGELLT
jgi:hypothetical protein